MFTLLWIPSTIAASFLQVARNAFQRGLLPKSGPWAATLVRFLFGLPFSLALALIAYALTPGAAVHLTSTFWLDTLSGAVSQVLPLDTPAAEHEGDAPTLANLLADSHGSPLDHAEQGELRAQLEAALRELPEAFRTVVILREIEGFAYEEISEILDVNIGTVKSRLTRGRSALRALLVNKSGIASGTSASYAGTQASKGAVTQ